MHSTSWGTKNLQETFQLSLSLYICRHFLVSFSHSDCPKCPLLHKLHLQEKSKYYQCFPVSDWKGYSNLGKEVGVWPKGEWGNSLAQFVLLRLKASQKSAGTPALATRQGLDCPQNDGFLFHYFWDNAIIWLP